MKTSRVSQVTIGCEHGDMGLFGRPASDEGPQTVHLDAAAQQEHTAASALVRALVAADLWLAVRELPAGFRSSQGDRSNSLDFLSEPLPDGTGPALQVFSTELGVQKRTQGAIPVKMGGPEVIELVLASYAGLVLDAAGPRPQTLTTGSVRDALTSL
jgi:hypothetical protein